MELVVTFDDLVVNGVLPDAEISEWTGAMQTLEDV